MTRGLPMSLIPARAGRHGRRIGFPLNPRNKRQIVLGNASEQHAARRAQARCPAAALPAWSTSSRPSRKRKNRKTRRETRLSRPVSPTLTSAEASIWEAAMSALTRKDVTALFGDLADVVIAKIIATGATRDE